VDAHSIDHHACNNIWTSCQVESTLKKVTQVVITDGSELLRLYGSSTKEPAMRAGIIWYNVGVHHRSEPVGCQHFSTQPELAAVVMTLQETPRTEDLANLIYSTVAIEIL